MKSLKWIVLGAFLVLIFSLLGWSRQKPKIFKTKIKKELVDLEKTKCSESQKFEEAIQKGDEYDAKMQAIVDSLNVVVWEEIGGVVRKYRKNYSLLANCNSGEICSVAYYHAVPKDSVSSVKDFFLYVYTPIKRIEVYCGKTLFRNIPVWDEKLTKEYLYK